MTYVLRAYLKLKHIWVVYDEQRRLFRPANWMDLPVKVILTTLFGIGLLYTSYLIWFTITTALSLLIFRINVLIIFLVTCFYCLCIGLSRLFSLGTKKAEEAAKILNRNKVLRDLTKKGKADIEITPNFLIKDGFVTSLEFIVSDKLEIEKLNKILVEVAKSIEKIK